MSSSSGCGGSDNFFLPLWEKKKEGEEVEGAGREVEREVEVEELSILNATAAAEVASCSSEQGGVCGFCCGWGRGW